MAHLPRAIVFTVWQAVLFLTKMVCKRAEVFAVGCQPHPLPYGGPLTELIKCRGSNGGFRCPLNTLLTRDKSRINALYLPWCSDPLKYINILDSGII